MSGSGRPIGLNLEAMNCTLKLKRWRDNAAAHTMVEVVRIGNRAPKKSHSTDSGGPSEAAAAVRICLLGDLRVSSIVHLTSLFVRLGWGVVISMSQQLHTYEQFGEFNFRNNPNCQLDLSGGALLQKAGFIAQVFWNKYYLDDDYFVNSNANTRFPAKYEVGPPKSDDNRTFNDMRTACSTPSVLSGPMFCDGEGYAERALKTYHTFLDNWNEIVEDEGYGVYGMKFAEDAEKQNFKDCASAPSKSNIQNLKAWIDVNKAGGGGKPNRFNDGVEEVIERWEAQPSPMASALYCAGQYQKKISNTLGGEKECLAAEFDCPDFTSPNDDSAPVLVPKDFLVDGSAIPTGSATMNDRFIPMTYMAFGPGTMNGSDGMDSVSRAMRIAGTWSGLPLVDPGNPGMAVYDDNFFMYKEVDQTSGYLPAFINPMHVGPYTRGPMKANWNKACPLEWSKKRRDRDCFSLQESIFGTKLLCQLETSKQVIDRDGMMTPPYGVGDLDDDALGELRQRCPRNARNVKNEDNLAEWTLFPPPARKDVCRGLGIRTCPSVLDCTRSAAEGLNSREFGPSCSKDNPSVQDCLNDLCRCCEERNPEPTCDFAQIEGTYTHFGGHNCPQQAALGGAYFGSHTGRVEINCDDQNRCKFKETISTLLVRD
ncbi:hypothetical protein THAOC_33399 [Thalassiosira oceanica]|uniref:Uncharacterized protein n=1 Tax=Thalassiosira oceanica TaxID=159749 RepID=K0R579_THAOC|nr:hypothetical protein THAOC_33399 [Thalassiosira oceanica]|eukprot:EJK47855.1 hypothetical protein THAOC_33399 [Thalassiosira oceanica]